MLENFTVLNVKLRMANRFRLAILFLVSVLKNLVEYMFQNINTNDIFFFLADELFYCFHCPF